VNTTFLINGGAGRVITSIPALEKYQRLNPKDDFKIIVHGWEQLFWSHPALQERTFGAHQKGLFEQYIKNSNVVVPEPYHLNSFFNQKTNLVEAFDEIINNTNNHSDLNYNCLHLSTYEIQKAKELASSFKQQTKRNKLIVFQPYGSAVEMINHKPIDRSNRSLSLEGYYQIAKSLSADAAILYASQPQFKHPKDNFTFSIDEQPNYLRILTTIISQCDLFVGVCSVGQHIARMLNKPSVILMGATNELNFGYPDAQTIIRKKDRSPSYTPWRLLESNCEFSDRANDGIMNFDESELKEIVTTIKTKISNEADELNLNSSTSVKYE
jgi:hypothetical protein